MSVTAMFPPAAKSRNRSIEARRAARLAKAGRERLIVDFLNRGVSVAKIAERIGVTEKRMRAIVREILARRKPEALEDFVTLQVSRLNEALLVAYSAMSPVNLRAVEQVVKIVRELDRYHGFFPAARRSPRDPRELEAKVEERLAPVAGPELAPQATEKARYAPGNDEAGAGLAEAAAPPAAPAARDGGRRQAPQADRPRIASQELEKARNAPENPDAAYVSGEVGLQTFREAFPTRLSPHAGGDFPLAGAPFHSAGFGPRAPAILDGAAAG